MFTIYIFILSPNHASNSMKYSKHLFLIYWQKRYTVRASYRVKIFDCKTCFWLICNKLVYRPTLLLQSHTLRLSSQTKLFYVTSMLCFTLLYVVALCVKMRYVILCIKRLLIDWASFLAIPKINTPPTSLCVVISNILTRGHKRKQLEQFWPEMETICFLGRVNLTLQICILRSSLYMIGLLQYTALFHHRETWRFRAWETRKLVLEFLLIFDQFLPRDAMHPRY